MFQKTNCLLVLPEDDASDATKTYSPGRFITANKQQFQTILLISLSFLLTSTGYLAWLDRLLPAMPENTPELLAIGLGYLFQSIGLFLFASISKKHTETVNKRSFFLFLSAYIALAIPSILVSSISIAILSGILANAVCGIIAGFYLSFLSKATPRQQARLFGGSYALATIATWLLSLAQNHFPASPWFPLGILSIVTLALFLLQRSLPSTLEQTQEPEIPHAKKDLLLPCALLFLSSIVNQIGFSFPSIDILNGINLEQMRLFYALGLLIAGYIHDENRSHGAILAFGALVLPFVNLALKNASVNASTLWSIGYLSSGFFSVFRIILFIDIANKLHAPFLAVLGLMFGRLGESTGTLLCYLSSGNTILLICLAAILYAITTCLFYMLCQPQPQPQPVMEEDPQKDEETRFQEFVDQYALSPRETEILTLLLAKETTPSIAEKLFVSESTVKFHVHNILKKTQCKNRKELSSMFHSQP